MRNETLWKPTKFVKKNNSFRTTSDTSVAGIGNRLIGNIQSKNYSVLIKNHATGILLDLGCGDVSLYEMYKPYVEKIYCTDWPKTLHGSLYHDFQMDLNKNFPIRENIFDTIILTDVLEHTTMPDNVWKEATRILKPGGKIIIGVPFFYLLHEEPYDYFRYSEFRLKLYCKENNLKIINLYPYGGSLEVFFDIIAKHISFSSFLSRINNLFGKLIINSFIGRKIYKITASKYPLGYCLVAQK